MQFPTPLQSIAEWVTYQLLSLEADSRLGASVEFFIYDSLKIILLLIIINYLMAMVRHYLPLEKIRDFLSKRKWYGLDYFMAALFGALTPFCSCSSIPLFVGFLGSGIPIGITFSFMITSPLVNEAAVAVFFGLFGWQFTLVYIVAGLLIGTVGGMLLRNVDITKHVSADIVRLSDNAKNGARIDMPREKISRELLKSWWNEGFRLTKKLVPYVIIGIGVGAGIYGFVPASFFEETLNSGAWWTLPIATIAAVPLYSNAVGVIPIMQALVLKGVPIGTALAFMMATVGLSLPEALIMKKIISLRLLIRYFSLVALGIIIIGLVVNMFFLGISL